jgi:hypothetical protein
MEFKPLKSFKLLLLASNGVTGETLLFGEPRWSGSCHFAPTQPALETSMT